MSRTEKELNLKHTITELKDQYKKSTNAVECRRSQVIWLLAKGLSRKEVQEITDYSDWSIRNIISLYNKKGLLGLRDNRHNNLGAPTILDQKEQDSLSETISKKIDCNDSWSGKKTVEWVEKETGKKISLKSSYNYMHKLGFSLQIPRPRHKLANLEEQENFKKRGCLSG